MMRAALLLLFLLGLASCASLSEDSCRQGDWYQIGARDGADGRGPTYVRNHFEACSDYGIQPDVSRWERGRQAGLPLYCTPLNIFEETADGGGYNQVCPAAQRPVLEEAAFLGRQYWRIGTLIDDARDDYRDASDVYRHPKAGDGARSRAFLRQGQLRLEIRRLEREQRALEREALRLSRMSN